ncbi:MAG: hypothetical protein JST54_01870 [Deltaproteobacteria bacterium]|nr:hypothetical protein [Deltaproteobacteria bacterium]
MPVSALRDTPTLAVRAPTSVQGRPTLELEAFLGGVARAVALPAHSIALESEPAFTVELPCDGDGHRAESHASPA